MLGVLARSFSKFYLVSHYFNVCEVSHFDIIVQKTVSNTLEIAPSLHNSVRICYIVRVLFYLPSYSLLIRCFQLL